MAALIAAIMARSTGAPAFESRTSSTFTTITTVAASAIGPSATPAAVSSTAAEGPLESGARIAADARGIPRKIFTWLGRATDARRTRFTGEKNRVVFNDCGRGVGFTCRGGDQFTFGARLLGARVFRSLVFCPVICFVFRFHMLAKRRRMLGTLVSGVGLGFRTSRRAASLDFLAFLLGHLVSLGRSSFFSLLGGFHFLFRLFVELRAANDSIGFGLILHLLMGGFDEVRCQGGSLIFA